VNERATSSGTRMIGPLQTILLVGGVLVTMAWIQLFILSSDTDEYFAWTIAPPLSAAFLGAGYGGAAVVAFQSGREREWAKARIGVPGVVAFVWFTLGATLLHLDRFHLDQGGAIARFAGWVWFLVYLLVPPALTVAYLLQRKKTVAVAPASEAAAPGARQPSWLRVVLVGLSGLLLVMGLALFIAPAEAADLWPWTLTPLVARAVSAWLVGVSLLLWAISRERNLTGLRAGFSGLAAIGLLQSVALLRYGDTVAWSAVRSWLYVLVLIALVAVGLYGWLARGDVGSSGGRGSRRVAES
jgi:hypothetical protein